MNRSSGIATVPHQRRTKFAGADRKADLDCSYSSLAPINMLPAALGVFRRTRPARRQLRSFVSSAAPEGTRSTVDQQELDKFRKLSSEWWDPNGRNGVGPLHAINNVRVDYIRRQAIGGLDIHPIIADTGHPLTGLKLVDIGCGGGLLSEPLARLGAEVLGIDPSEENIAVASDHARQDPRCRSITYRAITSDVLVREALQFDIVCALEVIEHVADVDSFLRECTSSLKPGGLLFLSTLNRTVKSYLMSIVGAEYVLGLMPPGTHDFKKFLQPHEVVHRLRKLHLEPLDVSGIVVDPLRWAWSIDPEDVDVNYILCAKKQG